MPPVRSLVLTVAGLSKMAFIALVLTYGRAYLGKAGLAVAVDSLVVVLYGIYLFAVRRRAG